VSSSARARALVAAAADEARRAGCHWQHADYEPHLVAFYEEGCGLRHTEAGLVRLMTEGDRLP